MTRVVQVLSTISYGDAVGNDAIAIYFLLKKNGFKTAIYAEGIDKRMHGRKYIHYINKLKKLKTDDVIIYHLSTGTRLNFALDNYKCRKIMIYHNITPPHFFAPYSMISYNLTFKGYEGLRYLHDKIDYCLADSEYNRQELIREGYQCPIDIRPVLIPFEDYASAPNEEIINRYQDGVVNIIFVGRIAPNKKQEDIIRIFCYYKKFINPNSRLILVGSYAGMEKYYKKLCNYVEMLGVEDIIFTGHVHFRDILAYYKVADIFLSMSEHEGFCVPLVEAMYFDVPIIAYDSSAIADTLGEAGILLRDKNPASAAMLMDNVIQNNELRTQIIDKQRQRLNVFSYENVSKQLISRIDRFLKEGSIR